MLYVSQPETDDETAASVFFNAISKPIDSRPKEDIVLFDAAGVSLDSLQSVFCEATCLSFSIVGCLSLPLCSILDAWETHCILNVEYYHPEGKRNSLSAQYLRSIWPFLHKPWFHPYCVKRRQNIACDGLIHADVALIDAA